MGMIQIFYKTVRSDYTSLYARGALRRKYVIGKRYRFHPDRPAHVFTLNGSNDLDYIYNRRVEKAAGNRVLICCGEVVPKEVPVFGICDKVWDFNLTINPLDYCTKDTCNDFFVVGEVPLPSGYNGNRPSEISRDEYKGKVIFPYKSK